MVGGGPYINKLTSIIPPTILPPQRKEVNNITTVNEYIDCQHCGNRIANKHTIKEGDYSKPIIIVPICSQIVKVEIQGCESRAMDFWDSDSTGYFLKTKLKCNCCKRHTTIKTFCWAR